LLFRLSQAGDGPAALLAGAQAMTAITTPIATSPDRDIP
jgi:hypothetical protein